MSMKSSNTKKYNFVYKTENLVNGLYYIGVHSTNILDDGYLGSGMLIVKAIKKYGKKNFKRTILKHCKSRKEAYIFEESLVNEDLVKSRNTYNCAVGGQGGYLGKKAIEKMRRSRKGQPAWNKGIGRAPNLCQKCDSVTLNPEAKLCRSCYKKSGYHAGQNNPAFVGWYLTPKGKFDSLLSASESTGIPQTTLRRWCKTKFRPGFDFQAA